MNQAIKQLTEQSETANIAAHVLWGAIEAELAGGKASTGAIAAGVAEVGARALTQRLYEKEPHELTTEEKAEVLELSKALAGLASGAVNGGSSVETLNAVSTGVEVAKNAVENNYLSKSDWQNYEKDIQQCHGDKECIAQAKEKFSEINKQNSEILKSACQLGGNSSSCNEQTSLAKEGVAYARENIPFEMTSVWQATMMRTTKKESEMKPSKALVGSETIEMLEKLSSNSQYQEMLANSQVEREKFRNQVDEATLDVRTEKGNAYEFGAYREYPNISSVGNYNYFGRELGLEPVYPEFYVLGGMGAKGLAKGINTISSTSTKVTVGINGAISAGSQYMVDGEINPKQVLWDMAEARITKDFSYKKFAVWNAGTGFVEGYSENGDLTEGFNKSITRVTTTSLGYLGGKKAEIYINPYFNPYRSGFETIPVGLNGSITKYKPTNAIPTGVGNLIDSSFGKGAGYIEENKENFNKKGDK
ncbi:VENN motif pre-toxin domain-containing protein [Actinobacillus equuli subsp. haemolyticus]|uniref:VENN motif pre-toxin domain-containing protein n=1 Tax=Actinobacillus equuli TaxID=718 RepID=UPI0024411E84|nr:VENN motif pre-toxin domain-containing protein [Actinobacillus equuli]WGE62395.1 VENN motif pre-toxin domain-containing protein [Actinobacillus equuli subsp. haemolyticus]